MLDVSGVDVYYGSFRAVRDVTMPIGRNRITALIGPSGCGKSTVLRCFNRMNDLIDGARVEGSILYHGQDLYGPKIDPVEVRRRIGMVFQKPNPFPKSIHDNVAFGPRLAGVRKSALDDVVESSLRKAALWDEVKDRLKASALGMSGGQQQRLCIARAIACDPDVLLMDEPCSALDPIATGRIEDLMQEIKSEYTIVIVTHNMQQAARVSDQTAFFTVEVTGRARHPHRRAGGVRRHPADLLQPLRRADGELRDRPVRVSEADPMATKPLRKAYEEGLADLRLQVEVMAAKVDSNLERMRAVLVEGDAEAAAAALAADDDIDATNLSLTERCYDLINRQQPVASDLRLVVSVVRVTSDLERIGDLALRIVKLAPEHRHLAADPAIFSLLQALADRAIALYRETMATWAACDGDAAARLVAAGSPTGELIDRLAAQIVGLAGPDAAVIAMRSTQAGQALDRIADHALVIAARVRYLVTGNPHHLTAEVR